MGQGLAYSLYQQNIKASTNLLYSQRTFSQSYSIYSKDGIFQLELGTLADSFGVSYRHLLRVIQEFIALGVIGKQKALLLY